jgi:hypothetical protein
MRRLTLPAVLVVLLGTATIAGAAEYAVGQGLVPVRNYQPIYGLSLQLPGESALPVKRGELSVRADVAETATALYDVIPTLTAVIKMNQLRSALDIRYGILNHTEIGLELASLYHHSGALDGLIRAAERLFGKDDPTRERLKDTGFAYTVTRNGRTVLQGTNGAVGLTDAVLHMKSLLVTEGPYAPATALRLAVKVPIGDRSRAFGTGVVDLGMGVALQKTVWDRLILYINANEVLPIGSYLGFPLRAYFTSVTGAEFMVTPKFSITGQFNYYQSPFRHTGTKVLDKGVTEGVLAFGYRFTPNFLWQVYGVQNLDFIEGSAADLTLATVLTYRIPRRDS